MSEPQLAGTFAAQLLQHITHLQQVADPLTCCQLLAHLCGSASMWASSTTTLTSSCSRPSCIIWLMAMLAFSILQMAILSACNKHTKMESRCCNCDYDPAVCWGMYCAIFVAFYIPCLSVVALQCLLDSLAHAILCPPTAWTCAVSSQKQCSGMVAPISHVGVVAGTFAL